MVAIAVRSSASNAGGNERSIVFVKAVALKIAVVLLVLLLAFASAIAVFEYQTASSLEAVIREQDKATFKNGDVITWLDTALNLTRLTAEVKPPNTPQYLTMLPGADGSEKLTGIYLLSTSLGFSYLPYTPPVTPELRKALEVSTGNGSIVLPHFG